MVLVSVDYGGQTIVAHLLRTSRKTLEISVDPDGTVTVTAPYDAALDQIHDRLTKRARWVREQQSYFAQFRPRTPDRLWVPGETHRYLGRQYRLRIGQSTASKAGIRNVGQFFMLDGIDYDDREGIQALVRGWYRERTRIVIARRLPLCVARFATPPGPVTVTVRSMSSRWASMTPQGRLTVNPALLRAPTDAIDYVVTHELAHRFVPDHSPRFVALLDEVMHDHAARKRRLERATS